MRCLLKMAKLNGILTKVLMAEGETKVVDVSVHRINRRN